MKTQSKPQSLRRLLMAAALLSSAAHAQTWTGNATSGNWTDTANWSSAPAFDTSTDLTFYQTGAANLSNFIGGNLTARSLIFNADADDTTTIRLTTEAANGMPANLTLNGGGSGVSITVNSGAAGAISLGVGNSATGNGTMILTENLIIDHEGSANFALNNQIQETGGNRSITKNGNGTIQLFGGNAFSGGLIINQGTVNASSGVAGDLGAGGNVITVTGGNGTLRFNKNGNVTYNNKFFVVGAAGGTMIYNETSAANRTLTFAPSSAGYFTTLNGNLLLQNESNTAGVDAIVWTQNITGTGRIVFEGNNNLSTSLADRRVQIGSNDNSGWSGGLQVRKGAANFTTNAAAGTGDYILGYTDGPEAAAIYTGGTGTFTNNVTVTSGGTRILQGTASGATWAGTFALAGNLTYDVTTGVNTISGNTTGAGGLIKTGNGTLVLPGAAGYTGATIINAGTLQIGDNGTTGSLSTLSAITNNGTLNFSRSNTVTQGTDFANVISGTGGVTHAGTGTLILSGNNSYDGATFISGAGGTLRITDANALGSTVGNTTIQGGAGSTALLEIVGGLSLAETITIGSRDIVANTTLRNVSGDSTLSGTVNLGAGGTQYNIESVSGLLTIAGNLTTQNSSVRSLNISGDGNVALGGTIADNGAGTIGVSKSGNGTLTLSGNSSYTGNTTFNGGTLRVNGSTAAASPVTVNSGVRLGGTGTVGGNVAVEAGGGLTFNLSTGNATFDGLAANSLAFNGNSTLTITTGGNATTGNYTLVATSSVVSGTLPAVSLPSGWSATPVFSGNDLVLNVTSVGGSNYTSWATTNVGGQAANLDFDGDGIDNGAEYFMGTAGNAFTANPQPVAGVITWPVAGVSGASAIVEVSNSLSGWTNAATTFPGSVNTSNPAQIQFTVPTGQGKLFYRLNVTVTPGGRHAEE